MPGIEAPSAFGAFQKGLNKKLEGKEVAPIEQAAPEAPPADRHAAEKAAAAQLEALFRSQAPQAPIAPEPEPQEPVAAPMQLSPAAAPMMQEALKRRAGPSQADLEMEYAIKNAPKSGPGAIR